MNEPIAVPIGAVIFYALSTLAIAWPTYLCSTYRTRGIIANSYSSTCGECGDDDDTGDAGGCGRILSKWATRTIHQF